MSEGAHTKDSEKWIHSSEGADVTGTEAYLPWHEKRCINATNMHFRKDFQGRHIRHNTKAQRQSVRKDLVKEVKNHCLDLLYLRYITILLDQF